MPFSRRSFPLVPVAAVALAGLAAVAVRGSGGFSRGVSTTAVTDSIVQVLEHGAAPAAVTNDEWKRVRALYAARANVPLWLDDDGRFERRARDLVSALGQVDRQGLRMSDYPVQTIDSTLAAARSGDEPGALARADVLLSAVYVDLATDLLTGRLDPRRASRGWHIDPRSFDVDSAVISALGDGSDMNRTLAALRPADEHYDALVAELARYRQIEDAGGWPTIPASPALKRGMVHPAVGVLRQRLAAEGYTLASAPARPDSFDAVLGAAVAEFQDRHGIVVDSAVGAGTRVALDVTAGRRADQIAANLERLRWLPPALGSRRIVVNVPAFELEAFDADRRVLEMRVVVGEELDGRNTPIFADSMRFVEFGPYWNVPPKIAVEEILPQILERPGYMEANDYEIVAGQGEDAPVVRPASLTPEDFTSQRYRVRQRPGPKNALGHVKFLFPNDFAVYLHDTPARGLFKSTERAASHGCVRVEDPAALARFVLADQAEWTPARIEEALAAGERERVTLARPIPVYIVYLTAFASEGRVTFREDIYDQDAPLIRLVDADQRDAARRDSVARAAVARVAKRLGGG